MNGFNAIQHLQKRETQTVSSAVTQWKTGIQREPHFRRALQRAAQIPSTSSHYNMGGMHRRTLNRAMREVEDHLLARVEGSVNPKDNVQDMMRMVQGHYIRLWKALDEKRREYSSPETSSGPEV